MRPLRQKVNSRIMTSLEVRTADATLQPPDLVCDLQKTESTYRIQFSVSLHHLTPRWNWKRPRGTHMKMGVQTPSSSPPLTLRKGENRFVPLGKGNCEKITQRHGSCLGRDAVLRVRLGFPTLDVRERVPTFKFFHSPRGQQESIFIGRGELEKYIGQFNENGPRKERL